MKTADKNSPFIWKESGSGIRKLSKDLKLTINWIKKKKR